MIIQRFEPIGVIDSGIGGISMLKELYKKYPNENYIYVADNKYMPYGNKTSKFLRNRVLELINFLKAKYNVKLVVLACNTASVTCLEYLSKHSNVMVVGLDMGYLTDSKHIILCTALTSRKYTELNTYSCGNLARIIEQNFFDKALIKRKILNLFNKVDLSQYKIVLGCTHYELISNLFTEVKPNNQYVLPCNDFVKNLRLDKANITDKQGDVLMIATLESKSYVDKLWKIFKS